MTSRYEALMDVVRGRMTNRAFAPAEIPRAHVEMILEAARHAPVGANAQPWHFIVVTDPAVKQAIGQCFVDEQQRRAKLRMGFPTPNYNGVKTAPGLMVVVADFRFVRAFPVLNDGSETRPALPPERGAHPAPVGRRLHHVRPPGRRRAGLRGVVDHRDRPGRLQQQVKPLLGVPDELSHHRRHVLRAAAQAVLQALEEAARPDRELGPLGPRRRHDRRADRRVGEDHPPQGHVPRRGRVD